MTNEKCDSSTSKYSGELVMNELTHVPIFLLGERDEVKAMMETVIIDCAHVTSRTHMEMLRPEATATGTRDAKNKKCCEVSGDA